MTPETIDRDIMCETKVGGILCRLLMGHDGRHSTETIDSAIARHKAVADKLVRAAHATERARCTRILADALAVGGLTVDQYFELVRRIENVDCPWTSADECAMARERSVAGTSDTIPTCRFHPDNA